jgi:tRNA dimethylallyltransferase
VNVIFIVGSTASGKSDYALQACENQNACLINCDSIQIYQGLEIGSSLPTVEERKRAPHFLFAYIPKGEGSTAGQYSRDFYTLMEEINGKYETAYVVGGTGFYFQAIEKGLFPVGAVNCDVREALSERLKSPEGAKQLYEEFKNLDPEAAKKIFPNDHYRLIRAMELIQTQGRTLSQIQGQFEESKKEFPWPLEKKGILVSKEDLLIRVQKRTKKMLFEGLVDEVKGLREQGFRTWAPMESVGYKETNLYLDGSSEIPNIQALEEKIIQNTMKLAKKQRTWFQRDKQIEWIKI